MMVGFCNLSFSIGPYPVYENSTVPYSFIDQEKVSIVRKDFPETWILDLVNITDRFVVLHGSLDGNFRGSLISPIEFRRTNFLFSQCVPTLKFQIYVYGRPMQITFFERNISDFQRDVATV